jgi:hypothetical protein
MKQRKFKELEISKFITPEVAGYLEKWISIGNNDEFVKRVYFTIREIHTIIKNYEAPDNSHKIFFQARRADKVPRFDKILAEATAATRAKTS